MNNFTRGIYGFKTNNVCHRDTYSLYIERTLWDLIDKAKLVDENLYQGKNDCKIGGIF